MDKGFGELRSQISDMQTLTKENVLSTDAKIDQLQALVKTTTLTNENKLLKRIIGWGLAIFGVVFSSLVILLVNA